MSSSWEWLAMRRVLAMPYAAHKRNVFPSITGTWFRNKNPLTDKSTSTGTTSTSAPGDKRAPRRLRADAQRNIDSLLQAAKAVFDSSGVEAPAKEIADRAGVGVGTLYRHFPRRSDLVIAVVEQEIDACADAAATLAAANEPGTALAKWLHRYVDLLAIKHGLAPALQSDDPALEELRHHFFHRFEPALAELLDGATAGGGLRDDVSAKDLLLAVAVLCLPVADEGLAYGHRMVALLIDGLHYGTPASQPLT
jgi:AcrR family transcriptional regulator